MCLREELVGTVDFPQTSITRDEFASWFGDIIGQLEYVFMCGNLGDPIMAPDALAVFEWIREQNPHLGVGLHTNGSALPVTFWRRLSELGVQVTFALDGLAATHALYRVGTDWELIIRNAREFIRAGGSADWQMLVFEHNEHQVEECRRLSEEMGFASFYTRHTTRFLRSDDWPVRNRAGEVTHVLRPSEKSKQLLPLVRETMDKPAPFIECKSMRPPQLYIAATGEVQPCCWMDVSAYNGQSPFVRDRSAKLGEPLNLHQMSLDDMFGKGYFSSITRTWTSEPLLVCAAQCGRMDRFSSEYST